VTYDATQISAQGITMVLILTVVIFVAMVTLMDGDS
jgi:hypothetical protein